MDIAVSISLVVIFACGIYFTVIGMSGIFSKNLEKKLAITFYKMEVGKEHTDNILLKENIKK